MKSQLLPVFNYSFHNQANNSVDIYIDGDIVDAETQDFYKYFLESDTSVSYKSFRDQITQSEASTFNIYINSGGGLVTDAMAIHDLIIDLQNNKGKTVNTFGRGIIASAATYILMASKNSSISKNSWFMIHNVAGAVWGDVKAIENYAATIRKFNNSARDFYANATGMTAKKIEDMMDSETWMTGSDAHSQGFVKNLSGDASFTNSLSSEKWQFKNTAVLNAYNSFTNKPTPEIMDVSKITDTINNGFSQLMEKLGLTNRTAEEGVQNAIKAFSDGIVNAVKESVPTQEGIATMVTNAITESLKENGAVANAINTAVETSKPQPVDVSNFVTKEEVVTNENLTTKLGELKNEITQSLVDNSGNGNNPEKVVKKLNNKAGNKYAGADYNA